MNHYAKGANFERKLVSDLWAHGWAAMRAAGSGTTSYPVPDVIAAKNGRTILVECKTTKKDRLSLKTNMLELKKFADISGGDAYLAIRFYRKEQRFYALNYQLSKGNYTITDNDPFLSLELILQEQKRL
jgi:Holliday junction resolvase